ncbi:13472_t:CDS:1, partial [Funneliformis geosporum]
MSQVMSTITRREKRCLIDFDTISPDRLDYALILICSRIIVRIQLKCFEDLVFSVNDIKFIVRKEIEMFPEKLARFSIQMKEFNYCHDLNDNTLFDCKIKIDPIVDFEEPLESIRKILNDEISSKRNSNPSVVKRIYRNLINLSDDLQKYFNDKKKHNIRPIYFLDTVITLYIRKVFLVSKEESFISFPVALVWLPTLTISDEIIQRNASAFYLRKKPEFL